MTDVLTLLEENLCRCSKGQRAISVYIRENYDKAAFMTAGALGKTVGVSESTVVRFAVELGFDGYPAMQKALQDAMVDRLSATRQIGEREPAGECDMLSAVLRSDTEMLRKTGELTDREVFNAAVEAIDNARQVFVIGAQASAPVASYLGYYLQQMLDRVRIITDGAPVGQVVDGDRRDVLIAVSFHRYAVSTAQAAEYCRSKGVRVVGITDSSLSPLGRSSNFALLTKSNRFLFVDSLTAPMSMAAALVAALAARREDSLRTRREELERVQSKYQVYEK